MKGTVFTILQDMIEETMGLAVWDEIVSSSSLPSEGIYTSAQHYEDEEIFTLVAALHNKTKQPVAALLGTFGEYLFQRLHESMPANLKPADDYFDYLESVHTQIHVEVKKLDENATLPELRVIERQGDRLVLEYYSPLKLCHLAIGLLKGSAELFGEKVTISMPRCMHNNDKSCYLEVTKLTS